MMLFIDIFAYMVWLIVLIPSVKSILEASKPNERRFSSLTGSTREVSWYFILITRLLCLPASFTFYVAYAGFYLNCASQKWSTISVSYPKYSETNILGLRLPFNCDKSELSITLLSTFPTTNVYILGLSWFPLVHLDFKRPWK